MKKLTITIDADGMHVETQNLTQTEIIGLCEVVRVKSITSVINPNSITESQEPLEKEMD